MGRTGIQACQRLSPRPHALTVLRGTHHASDDHDEGQRAVATVGVVADAALVAEILALRAENKQLGQALVSHAVIDQARGMVMALASCSSEGAWNLLVDVSQRCNVKLRDVAAALVATTEGKKLPQEMQHEWCRALRRLRAA